MKKYQILFVLILGMSSFNLYGQVYEKVYELASSDVQERMNQNKIEGIDILTSIHASQIVGLTGLNLTNKSALETILSSNSAIKSYSLNSDLSSISIESKASFTKEELTQMLATLSVAITGYTVSYSITEE